MMNETFHIHVFKFLKSRVYFTFTSCPKVDAKILSKTFDLSLESIKFALGKVDSRTQGVQDLNKRISSS